MSKVFAALLAQRFAPLDFSTVPGFPHLVPSIDIWGDTFQDLQKRKKIILQIISSDFINAWFSWIYIMRMCSWRCLSSH
jgi:hypothetical protein